MRLADVQGSIMTHQSLGVLLGLLLQLLLLMLLEPTSGGGEESAGDAGSHCDRMSVVGSLLWKGAW